MPRAFASSYLDGESVARAFLPLDFRAAPERAARARAAAERPPAPALTAALRAQQAALPPSRARDENLAALAAGGTAAVVTGQQVGLFLGPLYGFYKAASAIAVARALQAESGVRCVPLFWLQTEDHDYAEIASATVAGADGLPLRLALPPEAPTEARVSVAHRRLPEELAGLLQSLAAALGAGSAARETLELLSAHYQPGRPMAAAFAGTMAALFADEGLLVLDPRVPPVAHLAAPIYREAISAADEIERRLDARRAALAEAGFEAQIPPRAGCALVFAHRESAAGPRYRLARPATPGAPWGLAGAGAHLSEPEIASALAHDPLRFSTSALLRPIVQDTLLPTAAYVGGPAEVSYFAQLAPLYEHFRLPMPLVVPRARFRFLDARTRRRLSALGLDADAATRPGAARLVRRPEPPPGAAPWTAERVARAAAEIAPAVDRLAEAAAAADPDDRNLTRAAARTRATVTRALERLTARVARKLDERDGVARDRLARVQAELCPGGVPQERAYAWPWLAGRIGPAVLKALVLDRLAASGPYETTLRELAP